MDIVERYSPDGFARIPKLGSEERAEAIGKLKAALGPAQGKRRQSIVFLLAGLGVDYEKNRDYLLTTLRRCDTPPSRFVANLRRLGPQYQKEVCLLAGGSDGGGVGPDVVRKMGRALKRIGGEVALRCLREIESANSEAEKANAQ